MLHGGRCRAAALLLLAGVLGAWGCAGRNPLRMPGTGQERRPQLVERAEVTPTPALKPRAETGGGGPDPYALTPSETAQAQVYYDPYDGYDLTLPERWRAERGPFGARLTGPEQIEGGVTRLEGDPQPTALAPKGCTIGASRPLTTRSGPGTISQLACTGGTGTTEAGVSPGARKRVQVVLRSQGRSYLLWFQGGTSDLGVAAEHLANAMNVHP